jgi:hypothetical protein
VPIAQTPIPISEEGRRIDLMIDIEPIIRRKFSQADRADVQEKVCLAVERDPERFLAAYRMDSRSF